MTDNGHVVRLEIHSSFDMLDFVQLVSDRIGQMAGLDEDGVHWIGVAVRVCDEGEGFELGDIANPLAPENLLKSSGRGIFFMRSFMDDVTLRRRPAGGMEVQMTKRLPSAEPASA